MRRYAPQENLSFDDDGDHYDANYRPQYDRYDQNERQPDRGRYNPESYDNRGYADSRGENLDRDYYREIHRNEPPRPTHPVSYNQSPEDNYHRKSNILTPNQGRYDRDEYTRPEEFRRHEENRRPQEFRRPDENRRPEEFRRSDENRRPEEVRRPVENRRPEPQVPAPNPTLNEVVKKPSSPLSHSPDYVDPRYGQRPAYDFGFAPGTQLGLKPVSPPSSYKESSSFVPSFHPNDNHPAIYAISQPPLEMKPPSVHYEPRDQNNYRKSLIANKGTRSAHVK